MSDHPFPPSVGIFDAAPPLAGSDPGFPPGDAAWHTAPDPIGADPEVDDEVGAPEPLVEECDLATLAICAKLEHNDTDNGKRLLAHFGAELLHVREVGWHTYTGRVWDREGGNEAVTAYAQRTAARIHGEAVLLDHLPHVAIMLREAEALASKDAKDLSPSEKTLIEDAAAARKGLSGRRGSRHKHATTSGNGGRISAMITQALPHKCIGPKDLDADHMLFNCENATLRFSKVEDLENIGDQKPNYRLKVERLDHDRAHNITKIAPVVYDPEAKCPTWDAFLDKFQPSKDVQRFLQVYHGLALTGLTGQQCFLYNYGSGANGKSTFMEAMASLWGGYADLLNAESLTGQGQRRGDQATPDFAELPGVRYLRISELPRGEDLKEALVKSLTGGEEIKARHLNQGFFKFTPCFKAEMSGNDKPKIGGLDNGIWRRVRLVPWDVSIPDEERRPMNEVLAEFAAERPGILNWLLAGLDLYMREGLKTPEIVSTATAEYREAMDPIGAWVADCVVRDDSQTVTAREFYNAFADWCDANGIRPWQETAFGKAMPGKGFEKDKGRVRRYLNVRLEMGDVPRQDRSTRSPMGGGARA